MHLKNVYQKINNLIMLTFKKTAILVALCFTGSISFAQNEDMFADLNKEIAKQKDYAAYTFKSTRLLDGSTIENLASGVLDFRISHRFGPMDGGSVGNAVQNLYGVDNAITKIGVDFGITPWLMVGIGHSASKDNDGFVKAKILRQATNGMPFTLSYFGNIDMETLPAPQLPVATDSWLFTNRLFFTNQLLIARKFNNSLSLQLMPTLVHYNYVDSSKFSNNTFALGIGGRMKLTKRAAITAEYYYRLNNTNLLVNGHTTYNTFSLGYEVETGGHVFQFIVSNAQSLAERSFIGQNTDSWGFLYPKNSLHLGFNISRVFTIIKPEGFKEEENTKWSVPRL